MGFAKDITPYTLLLQDIAQSARISKFSGGDSPPWPIPANVARASIWFLIWPAPSLPYSTAQWKGDTATCKAVSHRAPNIQNPHPRTFALITALTRMSSSDITLIRPWTTPPFDKSPQCS